MTVCFCKGGHFFRSVNIVTFFCRNGHTTFSISSHVLITDQFPVHSPFSNAYLRLTPDTHLPSNALQLLLSDPNVILGQKRYIIHPACSGSTPESQSCWCQWRKNMEELMQMFQRKSKIWATWILSNQTMYVLFWQSNTTFEWHNKPYAVFLIFYLCMFVEGWRKECFFL